MTKRFLSILTTLVIVVGLVGILPVGAEDIVNNKPELKTNGVWVNGYIGYDDNNYEYDYYPIIIPSTGNLTVTMQSFGNLKFNILDSDYNSLWYSTSLGSPGDPENITFYDWFEKGTYYIRINEFSLAYKQGDYRVKASFISAKSNETESNDTYLQAQSVSNGSTITGTITRVKNDEYDYYKIHVNKKTKYNFYLSAYDAHLSFTLFDNNLNDITGEYLYDYVNGTNSVYSNDTKKFSYTLNKGTYYVRITGHSNGRYILKFKPSKSSSKKSAPSNSLIKQSSTKKPARVSGVFLKKGGKRKAKISWKKVSKAKGYQVKWSANKKFKKAKKKFTNKKTITLKKLNKKKYFIKVRAYKIKNGRKYYGKWSKTLKLIR